LIALSYSRIENMQCPHRFNRLYLLKDYQEPMNPAAVIGNKVHTLTAAYREHCIKNRLKRDYEWFVKKSAEVASPKEWPKELMLKFQNGLFSLVPPRVTWFCVEHTFKFNAELELLDDDADRSEIAFRLIPDFAFIRNGKLYVEDDKTGRMHPGSTQSKLYPALLAKVLLEDFDIKEVAFRYNMILSNTPIVHGPLPVEDTKKEIRWLKKQMKTVNEWTDFPKRLCKLCDYCKICAIEKAA
jgi:hypothetical protein